MPRPKKKKAKRDMDATASSKSLKKQTPVVKDGKYSVEDLLARVNGYLETFQFSLAIKFCEKVTF